MSRGGLPDDFIQDKLELDPGEFHQDLGRAFAELNKFSHVRPDRAPTEPAEVEDFADRVIGSFGEVFDVIEDVRHQIKHALERNLQDEAAAVFINETIENLDLLAGRYSTEGVMCDDPEVIEISSEFVRYRITGAVDVELQYGGKSDPVEIKVNFPFTCMLAAKVDAPYTFIEEMTEMNVDTSSWHGEDDEPETSTA